LSVLYDKPTDDDIKNWELKDLNKYLYELDLKLADIENYKIEMIKRFRKLEKSQQWI